jgi:hypothetical protein
MSCAGAEQEQPTASSAGASAVQQQLVAKVRQLFSEQHEGPEGFEQQEPLPAASHRHAEAPG